MMVVSEIGEQWSPQTAPAMQAEIAMMVISLPKPLKAAITIGMRIPKVPQEVPVANERPTAMRKMMAGSRLTKEAAEVLTMSAIKIFAPRLSVMPFSVQAKVRMRIAGTMALKPSARRHAGRELDDAADKEEVNRVDDDSDKRAERKADRGVTVREGFNKAGAGEETAGVDHTGNAADNEDNDRNHEVDDLALRVAIFGIIRFSASSLPEVKRSALSMHSFVQLQGP